MSVYVEEGVVAVFRNFEVLAVRNHADGVTQIWIEKDDPDEDMRIYVEDKLVDGEPANPTHIGYNFNMDDDYR